MEIQEAMGVFIAVNVSKGTHSFEMIFVPEGFELGKNISLTTLICIALYMIVIFVNRQKKHMLIERKRIDNDSETISKP